MYILFFLLCAGNCVAVLMSSFQAHVVACRLSRGLRTSAAAPDLIIAICKIIGLLNHGREKVQGQMDFMIRE